MSILGIADNFEAKLGIMYSGKEPEGKKAERRRYRLKEGGLRGDRNG